MKSVSGKEFCKALERKGWKLARIQGSHHIHIKPSNPLIISVPVHKNQDLKVGLLRKLMKVAGIKEKDL